MFEIEFPELLVIATITLVVVGPEKIPQVIKTVSIFFKTSSTLLENIKQEIEKKLTLMRLELSFITKTLWNL